MLCAPPVGRRQFNVTGRHARQDLARVLKDLADARFPGKRIVLVMVSLNPGRLSTRCDRFEPEAVARLAGRFEVRHTPKRGSWLNMAEIGINVLSSQCPGPPDPGPGHIDQRGRLMGGPPQRFHEALQLAVPRRERPRQAEVPAPVNSMMS